MFGVMSRTLTTTLPELLAYQLFIQTCSTAHLAANSVFWGGGRRLQNNDLYSIGAVSLPLLAKSHPECQKNTRQHSVFPEPEELPAVEPPAAAFVLVLAESERAVES